MDILIKNMEMPQERKMFVIEADGSVWVQIKDTSYFCTGSKAVALPEHGDLIQRDNLFEFIEKNEEVTVGEIYDFIQDAPTIVEASNGTDN